MRPMAGMVGTVKAAPAEQAAPAVAEEVAEAAEAVAEEELDARLEETLEGVVGDGMELNDPIGDLLDACLGDESCEADVVETRAKELTAI